MKVITITPVRRVAVLHPAAGVIRLQAAVHQAVAVALPAVVHRRAVLAEAAAAK